MGFIQAWQARRPQGGMAQWPDEWPLLELAFKLLCWIPELRDDPEGQVHLEAVARCIAQSASFSSDQAAVLARQAPHDDNSVKAAIRDVFVPLAESEVDVDEEVMPHVPRSRLPMMTIHQAKGLEFPLVVVDVGSDFGNNHAAHRFRRHPRVPSGVNLLEDELAPHCGVGPLRTPRPALSRAFDDLVRLYYVAFSRPQSVLLLVGLDSMLRTQPSVPHVGTGWRADGSWSWHSSAIGRRPPPMPDSIPLVLL